MTRVIYTGNGAIEPVSTIFTTTVDIDESQVQVSVGYFSEPGEWITPDSVVFGDGGQTCTATVTVGNGHINPVTGHTYYLWHRAVVDGYVLMDAGRDIGSRFTVDNADGAAIDQLPAFVPLPSGGAVGQVLGIVSLAPMVIGWITPTATVSVVDNGDGSFTGIIDNGDGSYGGLLDNNDGSYTLIGA